MPKPKSSRAGVRITPQPKAHKYVEAVFTDDFGRERALTVGSAASFSKKKVDAASRALTRKADRAMEQAIKAGDRETATAIRKLRRQERETDRAIDRFFRRKIKTAKKPAKRLRHKPPKPKLITPSRAVQALPSYGGFIRDRQNRIGVYFDVTYYSSRTARPGVAMRVTKYIWNGSALDSEETPMFRSNVGATIDEVVCAFDHIEQINRSAQKGAKILNSAVLAMDHRWTPEQMLEVGEAWAKERFGRYRLPYAVALHEPPPDGDQRNWHIHVIWSWRPLERVGDHEWIVSEVLRTDLDGREGMRFLRQRFAALLTQMSFRRGDNDVYTGLSHAARGLPIEPLKKLYEEKTRRARAGEFVADNEENHERVLRSKAAMIDDDLRREDERLARLQEIARRRAARIARTLPVLHIPAVVCKIAKLNTERKRSNLEALRPAGLNEAEVPRAPSATMRSDSVALVSAIRSWTARMPGSKFANLRNSALHSPPVVRAPAPPFGPLQLKLHLRPSKLPKIVIAIPAVSAPLRRFVSAAVTLPPQRHAPEQAEVPPTIATPRMPPRPFSFHSPELRNAVVTPAETRISSAPPVPPRSFAIKGFKVPKPVKVPTVMSIAEVASAPRARFMSVYEWLKWTKLPRKVIIPKSARSVPVSPGAPQANPVPGALVSKPLQRSVPQAIGPTLSAEIDLVMRRATHALREDDEQEWADAAGAKRKPATLLRNANSPWLLLQLLGERRSLIVKDKNNRWTLPPQVANAAGLTQDQIASPSMQHTLEAEARKQREELEAVAEFIAEDPQRRLIQTDAGWRAVSSAPEHIRALMYYWRDAAPVQTELEKMSKLASYPVEAQGQADLRKRQFLASIYHESEMPARSAPVGQQHGTTFPPPEWDSGRGM